MLARCLSECGANAPANRWTQKCSASVSARRRLIARARKSAQIASRITICGICSQRAASNRRGHSDRFALARTQRRRRTGNENVRASAARAQHCSSAARDLRAGRDKAGRHDRIPGDGMTSGSGRAARRKVILFSDRGWVHGRRASPEIDGWLFD